MQLKNIINRRNIGKDITGRVNEIEDFFELVVNCHLISATMHYFSMESLSDTPHSNGFDMHISEKSLNERAKVFRSRMEEIIAQYVISRAYTSSVSDPTDSHVNVHASRIQREHAYGFVPSQQRHFPPSISDVFCRRHASESMRALAPDGVFNYASALLNDGLLLLELKDAIREGDGHRILRCWKVLLMYFHFARHKNYQSEAFHLLAEVSAAASPRIASQLTWSRCVNIRGGKGKNIPLDLHMEHLNRTVKDHVTTLGANVAEQSILQCARSLKGLIETCSTFDAQLGLEPSSISHSKANTSKDEKVIIKELTETSRVFDYVPGRNHASFKSIHPSITEHINMTKLIQWIQKKKKGMQDNITKASIFGHSV